MRMRLKIKAVLVSGGLLIATWCLGQNNNYPTKAYDLENSTYKSEKLRCPRNVLATRLNLLRYNYAWNSAVTFDKAPDLWGSLASVAVPADTKEATPKGKEAQAKDISPKKT